MLKVIAEIELPLLDIPTQYVLTDGERFYQYTDHLEECDSLQEAMQPAFEHWL